MATKTPAIATPTTDWTVVIHACALSNPEVVKDTRPSIAVRLTKSAALRSRVACSRLPVQRTASLAFLDRDTVRLHFLAVALHNLIDKISRRSGGTVRCEPDIIGGPIGRLHAEEALAEALTAQERSRRPWNKVQDVITPPSGNKSERRDLAPRHDVPVQEWRIAADAFPINDEIGLAPQRQVYLVETHCPPEKCEQSQHQERGRRPIGANLSTDGH